MDAIKPLREMGDDQVRKIKLVMFDVDGVILPKGSDVHENADGTEFLMKTHKLSDNFVDAVIELKRHVRVGFSSGRNILYLKTIVRQFFDASTILQMENGGMTYLNGYIRHPKYPSEFFGVLYRIRERIVQNGEELGLRGFEPKTFILTAHMEKESSVIDDIVRSCDPNKVIQYFWGGEAYDFGLKGITKGGALEEIAKELNLKRDEIITTGNAMNDKEMLEYGVGVTVEPPQRVWGKYMTSGKGLGGEELARFLVERLDAVK